MKIPVKRPRLVDGVVTLEWLKWFSTDGERGWNRGQAEAIGVDWPLKQGWLRGLVGTRITEQQRLWFEQRSRRRATQGTLA